ncbi:MAG: hypothetical protein B6I38_08055 [Anaerolineaceae bacterium 4572_5.1]|nr:MAG: hypothetical protein B6I38_08055 [Anaerolineaceae bacterium 4572_5.1]
MDEKTTLTDIRRRVAQFVAARDWEQFHTPKNLSNAIAIEASELMECFLWLTDAEAEAAPNDAEKRDAIIDELADVMIYSLSMANAMGIDISAAIRGKLARNEHRFPPEMWRGRARVPRNSEEIQSELEK